ncbi:hypothetical protein MF451_003726 [Salmonella enterica subsp. enterica serovar Saintpaul]|nr:hypothetical protein [Salmonella enterica subsp. enterica serovar Saintpaul]
MNDLSKLDFQDLIYQIDLKCVGEATLRATETAVFVDWVHIEWVGSEAEGWTETRPTSSQEIYSHPRGFAVQAALEAFTEWHQEYMHERDLAGYEQQQHDLAIERRVERWFEEGIRS